MWWRQKKQVWCPCINIGFRSSWWRREVLKTFFADFGRWKKNGSCYVWSRQIKTPPWCTGKNYCCKTISKGNWYFQTDRNSASVLGNPILQIALIRIDFRRLSKRNFKYLKFRNLISKSFVALQLCWWLFYNWQLLQTQFYFIYMRWFHYSFKGNLNGTTLTWICVEYHQRFMGKLCNSVQVDCEWVTEK